MNLTPLCAVKGVDLQWVQFPPGKRSLQPVAIGAAVEVTILPKPSMQRVLEGLREQAGRNMGERRAGLETGNVGADPAKGWGRPPSQVCQGSDNSPTCSPTGVMATACLHREIERNTGSPRWWARDPT